MSAEAGHVGEPVLKITEDGSEPLFVLYAGGWTQGDILVWLESGLVPQAVSDLQLLMRVAADEIKSLRAARDGVSLTSVGEPPELTRAIESGEMLEKLQAARKRADALQEIVRYISEQFSCFDGAYRSHAITLGMPDYELYRYRQLRYITQDDETATQRLHRRLLDDLYRVWKSTGVQRPVLYWRYAPDMRIEETAEGGLRKLKTRVAIPRADWSVIQLADDEGPAIRI